MDELIDKVEEDELRDEIPHFRPGDVIEVHQRIQEGQKERIQVFKGIVIAEKGSGAGQTVTVRKISVGGIGVEKIFPIHSPRVEKIEVVDIGRVRRSKLYFLRERSGKSARVETKRDRKGL